MKIVSVIAAISIWAVLPSNSKASHHSIAADTAYMSWTYGSRVHSAFNQVYIRADSTSTGRILDSVTVGAKGTLIGGPWLAADGGQRWKVRYDAPKPTGWTRQLNLIMDTLFVVIIPPPPPPSVVTLSKQLIVWPPAPIPAAGAQVTLYTIYRDTAGTVSPGIHANWTSSNPLIATVDSFGRVVTLMPGIDTITATANGLTAKSIFDIKAWSSTPLTVLGMSIPSGQYDFYPTDSTGKKTAHITIWVLTP